MKEYKLGTTGRFTLRFTQDLLDLVEVVTTFYVVDAEQKQNLAGHDTSVMDDPVGKFELEDDMTELVHFEDIQELLGSTGYRFANRHEAMLLRKYICEEPELRGRILIFKDDDGELMGLEPHRPGTTSPFDFDIRKKLQSLFEDNYPVEPDEKVGFIMIRM